MALADILRSLFPRGPRKPRRLSEVPREFRARCVAYFDDPSHWQGCVSSNVHSFALFIDLTRAKDTNTLGVRFSPGHEITEYWYFGVPLRIYSDMISAASKGRFVWEQLRLANYFDYYKRGVVGYDGVVS